MRRIILTTLLALAVAVTLAQTPASPQGADKTVRVVELPTVSVQHDWLDYIAIGCTTLLVIIGYLGVRYARRTLGDIKRQADTMEAQAADSRATAEASIEIAKKAADAALLNAQAAMNAERAWITVNPKLWSPDLYPSWEPGTSHPDDPARMQAQLKMVRHRLPLAIKNMGKTPAQALNFACHYIHIASLSDLPEIPNYEELAPQGEHWIIPGDEFIVHVDLKTNDGILYEREVKDIRLRNSFLYAFGILEYRDAFGHEHRTQFGFAYHFPNRGIVDAEGNDLGKPYFRKDGPKAYNRAD
jgi:hypothetical protein